jgi:A118 family predicted phage portal protein
MNLIQKLKGAIKSMLSQKTVESALHITPTISPKMRDSIMLWEQLYKNESPWCNDENVKSLGLAALIASEKARTATIEMKVKVTGDSERALFIENTFKKVLDTIRTNLELGIALGGFVVKPYVAKSADGKYTLDFTYEKATDFYPLAFSPDGTVTEAAFVDRIITKDKIYSKLEYHKLEGTNLIVKNLAYSANNTSGQAGSFNSDNLGTPIKLSSVPAWSNLDEVVTIQNVDTMLFAYFKMPLANNIDLDSPLGVSGFARAVDLIRDADLQYSNLLWEFEGGQLAVDVDRTALNPMKDSSGKTIEVLPKLQDRLFRRSLDLGSDETYNVFGPQLRDSNIINGLNTILMKIEDACSLSRGTLSTVNYTDARTATELKILKQRCYAANTDIQLELERTLESVIYIMEKYCDLYNIVPAGKFEVSYSWDDSIIVDKDSERQVDLLDVDKGLMSKVEYRMKWKGETRDQAEEALKLIADEKRESMELVQSVVNTKTEEPAQRTTEAEASNDKLKRANESLETTKK